MLLGSASLRSDLSLLFWQLGWPSKAWEAKRLKPANPIPRLSASPQAINTTTTICVVKEVGDVWALERSGVYRGYYHVLGGVLSALDGVSPEDLRCEDLIKRASNPDVSEVILAMDATIDGQTTAHYLSEALSESNVRISRLARGMPVGGELEYLDDGTIAHALNARASL